MAAAAASNVLAGLTGTKVGEGWQLPLDAMRGRLSEVEARLVAAEADSAALRQDVDDMRARQKDIEGSLKRQESPFFAKARGKLDALCEQVAESSGDAARCGEIRK